MARRKPPSRPNDRRIRRRPSQPATGRLQAWRSKRIFGEPDDAKKAHLTYEIASGHEKLTAHTSRRQKARPTNAKTQPPAEPIEVDEETKGLEGLVPAGAEPVTVEQERQGLDEFGLEHGFSPVDLPHLAGHHQDQDGLPWASRIIALGALLLLFLNAHAIQNWSNQLTPGRYTIPMIELSNAWHERMANLGLTVPVTIGRDLWDDIKQFDWTSDEAEELPDRSDGE